MLRMAAHPGVREIAADGTAIRMTVEHGEEALPGMLRALDAEDIAMESIQLARPTLDDVFLTLTGRSLRDDSPDGAGGQDPGETANAQTPQAPQTPQGPPAPQDGLQIGSTQT